MAKLLKNIYNEQYLNLLSDTLLLVKSDFRKDDFLKKIFDTDWEKRELKQRMRHISQNLGSFLPHSYEEAIIILMEVFSQLPPQYNLENMIFQDFVEVYGLEDFDVSMKALEHFTVESSSEFAIRQFILKYPDKSMIQIKKWAKSTHLDVRRLASEGCRPRLPWAISLPYFIRNPKKVLEILDVLKDDESSYVRTSVANNLNDISKDNPLMFKKTVKHWIGVSQKRDMLLKQGCRTLLKEGDKEVLEFFGFKNKEITLRTFTCKEIVEDKGDLIFSFTIESYKNLGKLRIEYAITFVRMHGKNNKKVFKISEGDYEEKSKTFKKLYSFKPISTRKYYPGVHYIEIIVNGIIVGKKSFILR